MGFFFSFLNCWSGSWLGERADFKCDDATAEQSSHHAVTSKLYAWDAWAHTHDRFNARKRENMAEGKDKKICRDVDEPSACRTEWNKSERERQISYRNAYMWSLERQYWWACLQGSIGDADVTNGRVDTGWGEGGTNWERPMDMCTLPCLQ